MRIKNVYRTVITILLCNYCFAQISLIAFITDKKNNKPLEFCNIVVKTKKNSALSNEDGIFILNSVSESDTLIFSRFGYKNIQLKVSTVASSPTVYLTPSIISLPEVVVNSNNNYLYNYLEKIKNRLKKTNEISSKAYFILQSDIDNQPIELIESYYNSKHFAGGINELKFKNGRIGISPYQGNFYINKHFSKIILSNNLVKEATDFLLPIQPLELSKKKMKQYFNLKDVFLQCADTTIKQIDFFAKKEADAYYNGTIIFNASNFQLSSIILNIANTNRHPLKGLFSDTKLKQKVNLKFIYNYDSDYRLKNISFDLVYNIDKRNDTVTEKVHSKGFIFFYDYNNPFLPTYFDYPSDFDDYRMIISLSYNTLFWKETQGMLYSNSIKKSIKYFKDNGKFLNFNSNKIFKGAYNDTVNFFEQNYITWSPIKRLNMNEFYFNKVDESNQKKSDYEIEFYVDKYKLKTQIYFDLNNIGDSLNAFSTSVFDVYNSFIRLTPSNEFNCVLNIYFDICEVNRRELIEKIKNLHAQKEIESLYKKYTRISDEMGQKFLEETQSGKNKKELKKWNNFIYSKLKIDNMKIAGLN